MRPGLERFYPLPKQSHGVDDPHAERRRYKREYMRRWRADSRHRASERKRSRDRQMTRESREAASPELPVCGFCRKREPVRRVLRLAPAGSRYVKLLVPYCGVC